MMISDIKSISGWVCRKAKEEDIPAILDIISQARESMKQLGIDQWQDGYPDADIFLEDIRQGQCYVCEVDSKVAGVMVLTFTPEESYENMQGSGWLSKSRNYAVIHRMAVGDAYRGSGLSGEMIGAAEKMTRQNGVLSLRTDTHRGNIPMQKFMNKMGFVYCGNVEYSLICGDRIRMAYEKIISTSSPTPS